MTYATSSAILSQIGLRQTLSNDPVKITFNVPIENLTISYKY